MLLKKLLANFIIFDLGLSSIQLNNLKEAFHLILKKH